MRSDDFINSGGISALPGLGFPASPVCGTLCSEGSHQCMRLEHDETKGHQFTCQAPEGGYPGDPVEKKIGKLSKRQHLFSRLCKIFAGGWNEERTTNLVSEHRRIRGLRLWLYWKASHLRYAEGNRLVAKYGTHSFI